MDSTVSHSGHGAAGTFAELWSPGLLLLLLVVGVLYTLCVNAWRHRFADSEPVPLKLQLYGWLGLILWYAAEGSPLAYYGHHYFFQCAHVSAVHLVFNYAAAPAARLAGMAYALRDPRGNG